MASYARLVLVASPDGTLGIRTECGSCHCQLETPVIDPGTNPLAAMLLTVSRTVRGVVLELDGLGVLCAKCSDAWDRLGIRNDSARSQTLTMRLVPESGAAGLPSS
jgi:hypothetical protein